MSTRLLDTRLPLPADALSDKEHWQNCTRWKTRQDQLVPEPCVLAAVSLDFRPRLLDSGLCRAVLQPTSDGFVRCLGEARQYAPFAIGKRDHVRVPTPLNCR